MHFRRAYIVATINPIIAKISQSSSSSWAEIGLIFSFETKTKIDLRLILKCFLVFSGDLEEHIIFNLMQCPTKVTMPIGQPLMWESMLGDLRLWPYKKQQKQTNIFLYIGWERTKECVEKIQPNKNIADLLSTS